MSVDKLFMIGMFGFLISNTINFYHMDFVADRLIEANETELNEFEQLVYSILINISRASILITSVSVIGKLIGLE